VVHLIWHGTSLTIYLSGPSMTPAKALLQTILQAVHVYLEGRLEVEFRR